MREDDYTAGEVVQVMTAMLIGGFALGQAAPDFSYYVSGRAAIGRLMRVIKRKPLVSAEGGITPAAPMQARSPPSWPLPLCLCHPSCQHD